MFRLDDLERPADHLGQRPGDPRYASEPASIPLAIEHPVEAARDDASKRDGRVAAEAGAVAEHVAEVGRAAAAQTQAVERGVRLHVGRKCRQPAELERAQRDRVLQARSLCETGQALEVRDRELRPVLAERILQHLHLGLGAPVPRGGVRLVRHVQELLGELVTIEAVPLLDLVEERSQRLARERRVRPRRMSAAVPRAHAEQLRDRFHPAFAYGLGPLDHEAHRAHADQRSVPPCVERQRRLLDRFVGRRGADGEEPGGDPLENRAGRDIVGCKNDRALGAAATDHVLRGSKRNRRRGARRVQLHVRPSRLHQLGKEDVARALDGVEEVRVEAIARRTVAEQAALLRGEPGVELEALLRRRGRLQSLEIARAEPVGGEGPVAVREGCRHFVEEDVVGGEGGRVENSRVVLQRLGQNEPSTASATDPLLQRDPRIAQALEAGGDGELEGRVGGQDALVGDSPVGEVEASAPAGELDGVAPVADLFEPGGTVAGLHEADDVLLDDAVLLLAVQRVDQALTLEQALDAIVREDAERLARQADREPGDDERLANRAGVVTRARPSPRSRTRRRSGYAGGAQLFEHTREPLLRGHAVLVCGKRHVRARAEDLLDEGRKRATWANFDERPHAVGVQALDETGKVDRGGELFGEECADPPSRVLARLQIGGVDAREHRHGCGARLDAGERLGELVSGRPRELGVECPRDRQQSSRHGALLEQAERLDDGLARARNHGLQRAVPVRDGDGAGDRAQHRLHCLGRRRDRSHRTGAAPLAKTCHRDAARVGQAYRFAEREDAGGDERAVLAEAVPRGDVGLQPCCGKQTVERDARRDDDRLDDLAAREHRVDLARVPPVAGEDELLEWRGEEPGECCVRFAERRAHELVPLVQIVQHVRVVAALAGEEHREPAGTLGLDQACVVGGVVLLEHEVVVRASEAE